MAEREKMKKKNPPKKNHIYRARSGAFNASKLKEVHPNSLHHRYEQVNICIPFSNIDN